MCRAGALSRKQVLAAWLTEVITLCMKQEPLLLFFHGSSDTEYVSQMNDDALRDSTSDALKDLVLVSHVTIRVAPAPTVSKATAAAQCRTHTLAGPHITLAMNSRALRHLINRASSGRVSDSLSSGSFLKLVAMVGGSCAQCLILWLCEPSSSRS